MAASALLLALTSDHLERPTATALYRAYLTAAPMLIGLYWWRRRAASRFGPLLIAFGVVAWVVSWQSSDWPLAFDLGVLAEAPYTILTFWLFLAFPSGRLETRAGRLLIAGWTVGALGFFVPWALGSPVIAGGGPLSTCVPACPSNVLQIGSAPALVEVLGRWETYIMLALTVAVLAVYAARLRSASRPRRRALVAVAATSLLFMPVFFTYHFSRQILTSAPGRCRPCPGWWWVPGSCCPWDSSWPCSRPTCSPGSRADGSSSSSSAGPRPSAGARRSPARSTTRGSPSPTGTRAPV